MCQSWRLVSGRSVSRTMRWTVETSLKIWEVPQTRPEEPRTCKEGRALAFAPLCGLLSQASASVIGHLGETTTDKHAREARVRLQDCEFGFQGLVDMNTPSRSGWPTLKWILSIFGHWIWILSVTRTYPQPPEPRNRLACHFGPIFLHSIPGLACPAVDV